MHRTPPDLMQMGGGIRGQKDEGESPKNGVWKGVGKTSHQHTPKGGCGVLVYVGVQWPWWGGLSTGRGDGDAVFSFLLNKNGPK